jgi:serine-type D-Ala-D-Ala carboxypeptidase/endopeptidase (penicillin-binding protein 4)
LYTKKSKLIIFSVLVNGFQGSATKVRRSVEKFLEGVREDY